MNKLKKLLALVLALAICATFALPALAAGDQQQDDPKVDEVGTPASDGPFTLTLNGAQNGHTYVVYQLLTGNPAKNGDKWVLANVGYGSSGWKMDSDMEGKNPQGAADMIASFQTEQELKLFLAGLNYGTVEEGGMTVYEGSSQTAKDSTTLTWSLPGGYYIIKDTTTLTGVTDDVVSAIMVSVVGSVDVNTKLTKPTPDKDIDNADPEVVGGPYDYNVGDMIPYVLSATVPVADLGAYVKPGDVQSTYKLTFRDYMPTQLTYLPTKADIKVYYNVNGIRTEIGEDKYTINNNPSAVNGADGTTKTPTFEVQMDLFGLIGTDPTKWTQYKNGDNILIEVTYEAMLNAIETVPVVGPDGEPIKNQVELVYPNNPNDDTQEGSSVSPPKEVPVYTFEIDGVKVDYDDNTKTLSGAVFELHEGETTLEFVEDSGKYILWSNTAYSDKMNEGEGESLKNYVYKVIGEDKDGEPIYEMKEGATEPNKYYVVTSVTSDTNGKFAFGGLKEGTYILHETKAPAGYNKLKDDITIKVDATYGDDGKLISLKYNVDETEITGNTVQVENNMGSELPSTGGIGTTIFYIVGAVLVVGAGVLLFTKRRAKG